MKQEIGFWNSEYSINQYAKMCYKLTDAELNFISDATQLLSKPISRIKILDLGCGGGRTTVPLFKMGYQIIGVDIAKNLIAELRKKFPKIDARIGDATKLNLKDKSFDIVLFSFNSLDYLYPYEKRLRSLKEIWRVLKPAGFFVFSSHVFNIPRNFKTLEIILRNLKCLFENSGYYNEPMKGDYNVKTYFASLAQIRRELSKNGFDLLKHTRVMNNYKNLISTFIRNSLNWQRYYLARKE